MKILLTGGTGAVGVAAVQRLVAGGHDVLVIGRRGGFTIPGARYAVCDITDYAALRAQARGQDAIVHLAAIPNPSAASSEEIFRINASGTYNVFQAAAEEGIRRVVQASSINALGLNYGIKIDSPQYFPIDEDHPCVTSDPYSFSKVVIEEIGRYFWHREGISSVALRLPAVWRASARDHIKETHALFRGLIDRLLAMPEGERTRTVDDMLARINAVRSARMMEIPPTRQSVWGENSPLDHETRSLMGHRNNFWTLIDERDSAQAIEKGLLADYEGAHAIHVHDAWNAAGVESETLLRLFFPNVTARKRPLVGAETLISIERAHRLIGFWPEYSYA